MMKLKGKIGNECIYMCVGIYLVAFIIRLIIYYGNHNFPSNLFEIVGHIILIGILGLIVFIYGLLIGALFFNNLGKDNLELNIFMKFLICVFVDFIGIFLFILLAFMLT